MFNITTPEQVGISNGYNCHTNLLCLFNGNTHRLVAKELTHTVITLNNGRNGSFKNNFWLCVNLDKTFFNALMITHKSLHTVRFDAVKVTCQQNVNDNFAFALIKAEFKKCIGAEFFKLSQEQFILFAIFTISLSLYNKILSYHSPRQDQKKRSFLLRFYTYTVSTTFPTFLPLQRISCAASASVMGKTAWMVGFTSPASIFG